MAEFSLRDLTRQVLAESAAADPETLAKELAGRIPRGQAGAALGQALRVYVHQFVTRGRMQSAAGAELGEPAAGGVPPGRSRVQGVHEAWARRMGERYHVGGGTWKVLAEMTGPDCLFAAAERRQQAAANVARAEEFEVLAQRLAAAGAERVRDLFTLEERAG